MARRWVVSGLLALLPSLLIAGSAFGRTLPLLPLARGQIRVLLGDSPYWLPVSGTATELSLLAGPPRGSGRGLNAYVALQSDQQGCARSAQADRSRKLTFGGFYAAQSRLPRLSALAPAGGAKPGVYLTHASATIVQRGQVRACVWLAPAPTAHARPIVQEIPLLNGLFAASVAALPDGSGPPSSYSVDVVDMLKPFSYGVSTTVCGITTSGPRQRVPVGETASESITIGSGNCPADGSSFSFFGAGGRSLGRLTYPLADAGIRPPVVAHLGACDLNGVAGTTRAAAESYVNAVGCQVGRLLKAPYDQTIPRGYVTEAQVDGGIAEIAPRGTKVDLVLDG